MAISNMMNSIRAADPVKQSRIRPEWKAMFEKLDRLVKLQLIICPHSFVHEDESIVTPVFKELKQMYEHLGNGVKFYDIETIVRYQYYEAFTKWLEIKTERITIHDIVYGDLNAWQDRIRISIDSSKDPTDYVQELEKAREVSSAGLTEVFNRWKTETHKTFMDWFNEEKSAYGRAYWQSYIQAVWDNSSSGVFSFVLSEKAALMIHLSGILRQNGVTNEEAILKKLAEFFQSEQAKEIPFLTNYSALVAVLANQAAHGGRSQPPNIGTSNDLSLVSAFAPYCDALFIDNPFKDIVKQANSLLNLGTYSKFYSANDFKGFFDYLDSIEASAPKDHLDKVKEVYGDDWEQPYTTMYQ
jgi:hypothetical protein